MELTQDQKDAFDMQAMGVLRAVWIDEIKNSITYRSCGLSMVLMSLLSDSQELIRMDYSNEARQMINKVKCLILAQKDGIL